MSRLVVVSNRVASIQEGEATAGGLAAGVLDALREKGGVWFGWSGTVTEDGTHTATGQFAHIGGVMPSRPTETAEASSVPSSFLFAAPMKILAPGLSSLLSPGT